MLEASLTTSDAGGGQKDGVPSGCRPNRPLLRQNSYAYYPSMQPSFFLAAIRFGLQRGSRQVLLERLS